MVNQLIVSHNSFLNGLTFKNEIDKSQYILDYLDIGSIPLRSLKVYVYRKIESPCLLYAKELKAALMGSLTNGRDVSSYCFCINEGKFLLPNSAETNLVLNTINNYVGVIFQNY
ncbi:hypothetical protein SDC9_83132 [bioreactor metagenome]|uniref:Uncharacterized protein n=1 Tax=bioreactor metagenome TaxID=1076179 RepID=A0A644ZF89_9ZZZZ